MLLYQLCNLCFYPKQGLLISRIMQKLIRNNWVFFCFHYIKFNVVLMGKLGWEGQHGVVSWGEDQSGWNISASQAGLDRLCWERHSWANKHIFSWGWWFWVLTTFSLDHKSENPVRLHGSIITTVWNFIWTVRVGHSKQPIYICFLVSLFFGYFYPCGWKNANMKYMVVNSWCKIAITSSHNLQTRSM